ncbi:MAG TPA: SH3 domain-containing protein [Spirochaetota bacterium]|nr:SH3 domain-containing protein [Spirochaetota bacterium]
MKKAALFVMLAFAAGALLAQSDFQPGQAKVTTTVLNVRNVASSGGTVIGSVKRGELINVTERSKNRSDIDGISEYWYRISLPKGKNGWVFGGYISFEVNLESGLRWKALYPGGGENFGPIYNSAKEVITGTDQGSVYLSGNNGGAWRKMVPQALGNRIGRINRILVQGNEMLIAASGGSQGGIWKSTTNGQSWSQFTTSQGLLSNDVFDIVIAKNAMYAATGGGVVMSTNKGVSWSRLGSDNISHAAYAIAVADDGRIFAGTSKGLFSLQEKRGMFGGASKAWVSIGSGSPNMGNSVYAVALSKKGDLYAGTEKGLNKSNIASLDNWQGIGGRAVVSNIFIDKDERVIVGTGNGLNISADGGLSWVTYKTENGLSSNAIRAASVSPSDKTIWVTNGFSGVSYNQ